MVDELFDDFEVDVSLEERHAYFFQRFLDVLRRKRTLAAQVLERSLQFFLKILKHRMTLNVPAEVRSLDSGSPFILPLVGHFDPLTSISV